jgi:muconate cycloisomerase
MRLASAVLYRIRIQFRQPMKHASADRDEAENLVLRAVAEDGVVGWGETIAREYVTGETTGGTQARWEALPRGFWSQDFSDADGVQAALDAAGLRNAARCGIEVALLDLLSRRAGQPLDDYLARAWPDRVAPLHPGPFEYNGTLSLGSWRQSLVRLVKGRLIGFRSGKLKLGRDLERDARLVRLARRVLGGMRLRVDANEAWDVEHAAAMAPVLKSCGIGDVEQPLPKTRGGELRELQRRTGLRLVLDESLCSLEDAQWALDSGLDVIFSLKLAKLGGFGAALRVAALARERGVPIQIGCQVGESAILSAAGRRLAAVCPNLRDIEGSFDRFLLRDNVIEADISFGWRGRAPRLRGTGLGIDVDPRRVARLAVDTRELFRA